MAGYATSTGFAGHAGATANSKLTFHLDHPMGADHVARPFVMSDLRKAQGLDEIVRFIEDKGGL